MTRLIRNTQSKGLVSDDPCPVQKVGNKNQTQGFLRPLNENPFDTEWPVFLCFYNPKYHSVNCSGGPWKSYSSDRKKFSCQRKYLKYLNFDDYDLFSLSQEAYLQHYEIFFMYSLFFLWQEIGTSGWRSRVSAFGWSTGKDISGHYKHLYFLFFFSRFSSVPTFSHRRSSRDKTLIWQKLTGAPQNPWVDTFLGPVSHFGAP